MIGPDSFVRNCVIAARLGDEPLFEFAPDHKLKSVRLDGYAVVPVEWLRQVVAARDLAALGLDVGPDEAAFAV